MQIHTKKINTGQIDVWICRAVQWAGKRDELFSELSPEEQERALRFKFSEHKEHFVIFHGFMRRVLGSYLAIEASCLMFKTAEKGKPYLVSPDNKESPLNFNLSHTEDIALLAVSSGQEVGIDIENRQRSSDWQGIARRFCTQEEQKALFSAGSTDEQREAFYDLWTRKEAYMKVLGSGMALSPTQFSLTVAPKPPALLKHYSEYFRPNKKVVFETIKLPKNLSDYCATLAVQGIFTQYKLMEPGSL